jgi:hypothetical protein
MTPEPSKPGKRKSHPPAKPATNGRRPRRRLPGSARRRNVTRGDSGRTVERERMQHEDPQMQAPSPLLQLAPTVSDRRAQADKRSLLETAAGCLIHIHSLLASVVCIVCQDIVLLSRNEDQRLIDAGDGDVTLSHTRQQRWAGGYPPISVSPRGCSTPARQGCSGPGSGACRARKSEMCWTGARPASTIA